MGDGVHVCWYWRGIGEVGIDADCGCYPLGFVTGLDRRMNGRAYFVAGLLSSALLLYVDVWPWHSPSLLQSHTVRYRVMTIRLCNKAIG
jgi:hypothetical protein